MTTKRPSKHCLALLTLVMLVTATLLTGIAGCPGDDTNLQRDEPPLGQDISFEGRNQENREILLKQGVAAFFNDLPDNEYFITAQQLREQLERNPDSIQIVDVRNPGEFRKDHIEGAKNIPLQEIGARFNELRDNRQIVLVCSDGQAAAMATAALNIAGFRARNLKSGFQAWSRVNQGNP